MNKKRLIILILVIIAVWFFWSRRNETAVPETTEQSATEQQREESEQSGSVQEGAEAASGQAQVSSVATAGRAFVHYFTKDALEACKTDTVTLEQTVDPQYGHPAAGALVAQTSPLPTEAADEYVSALGAGTRLIVMRIDKEGVATADYNRALNEGLNDCNRAQRRAQIVNTLKEFSQIKDVVITVNGEKWE